MLAKIKKAIRRTSSALDDYIGWLVGSCKADLMIGGIYSVQLAREASIDAIDDPLLQQAVILYCKRDFADTAEDAERYGRAYENIKVSLALSGDYAQEANAT